MGGNSRCVALLEAVKDVIADYIPPPNSSLSRTLNDHLKPMIHYLVQCRPLSISMGNGIRFVKRLISSTRDLSDEETRTHLIASIDDFIDKRIKLADELIMRNLLGLEPHTTAKIVDGDVVLTHGELLLLLLLLLLLFCRGGGNALLLPSFFLFRLYSTMKER